MAADGSSAYTRRETLRMSLGGALAGVAAATVASAAQRSPESTARRPNGNGPIRSRTFWTWDHCTEWKLNQPGAQTIGASNPYGRTKESFEGDYTRLLEYCGRHHIDAVVVWGLLRDHHGGVESAKRLADVAAENNVRLLCGVGLCAYGGVYYQGDSPHSLDLHLQKHPELKALDEQGKPREFTTGIWGPKMLYHACPSRRENQELIADGLRWLFETIPSLGGVQIEAGDTGVCRCRRCEERRRYPVGKCSWEDLALLHPIAIEAVRAAKPDAWIFCETYSHPQPHAGPEQPPFGGGKTAWADECLARLPDGVFVQWVYDQLPKPAKKREWTKAGDVDHSRFRHILRAHFGTYWSGIRGEPALDDIATMAQECIEHKADVTSLFGEVSPFVVGAELNYLALENLGSAANPKADLDVFIRDVAGPLLGGEELAREYLAYAKLKDEPARIPEAMKTIRGRCGSLPPEPAQRWIWLGNYLASFAY